MGKRRGKITGIIPDTVRKSPLTGCMPGMRMKRALDI